MSLSDDGNTLAVGAYGFSSSRGRTRVYKWDGSLWGQIGVSIEGEASGDNSGKSVSLSGDGITLAVVLRAIVQTQDAPASSNGMEAAGVKLEPALMEK